MVAVHADGRRAAAAHVGFQINALLAPHTSGAERQEAVLEGLLGTLP